MATSSSRPMMEVDERERRLLAPYAMFSADSAGRVFPEADHPYRGPFQRDRDRILHSSAYRRLSGQMQVFTGEMGDTIGLASRTLRRWPPSPAPWAGH